MKNKKLIFIIVVAVIVLFFIIDIIRGIQTNLNRRKDMTDSEQFLEDFGSVENYSFSELIAKEDFGDFTSFRFSFDKSSKNKDVPFYETILEDGFYVYKDKDFIKQITEIFQKQDYTYSQYSFWDSPEQINHIWSCRFGGYNDISLVLNVYEVENVDILLISMSVYDNLNVPLDKGWFSEHMLGMFTDKNLSENLSALLEEHTERISLEKAKQIISENTGEMSGNIWFEYQNSMYQKRTPTKINGVYQAYKQELKDSEDYLLLYETNYAHVVDGVEKQYHYIFRVELCGSDETLKEVLYDDMERYENDVVKSMIY